MQRVSDELAAKTLTFWRISQAWNRASTEEVPMYIALGTLADHISDTNPARPIVKQMLTLQHELIHDSGRKSREASPPVTPLHKQA